VKVLDETFAIHKRNYNYKMHHSKTHRWKRRDMSGYWNSKDTFFIRYCTPCFSGVTCTNVRQVSKNDSSYYCGSANTWVALRCVAVPRRRTTCSVVFAATVRNTPQDTATRCIRRERKFTTRVDVQRRMALCRIAPRGTHRSATHRIRCERNL